MKAPKKFTITLVGALAALALGSFAWAAIPDNGGMIHGCYKKDSGAVRVYDSSPPNPKVCTSKEGPLDWSQQGPSEAYFNPSSVMSFISDTSWPGSYVTSTSVPQGSYVFMANAVGKPFGANSPQHQIFCRLVAHDNESGYDYWTNSRGTVASTAFGETVAPMTLSVARTFGSQGGTVTLRCIAPVDSQVESNVLTALQVGVLH